MNLNLYELIQEKEERQREADEDGGMQVYFLSTGSHFLVVKDKYFFTSSNIQMGILGFSSLNILYSHYRHIALSDENMTSRDIQSPD